MISQCKKQKLTSKYLSDFLNEQKGDSVFPLSFFLYQFLILIIDRHIRVWAYYIWKKLKQDIYCVINIDKNFTEKSMFNFFWIRDIIQTISF